MKVGTDGVILGAWTNLEGCRKALDVGSGTGLLALMLAQRSRNLFIDAIEIDAAAAAQARENIRASRFSGQIELIHADFMDFKETSSNKYDLIICNPPFFKDSYKPKDFGRKLARHTDTLQTHDILSGASHMLTMEGNLSLIIPFAREKEIVSDAERSGLFLRRKLEILSSPGKQPSRVCIEFRREQGKMHVGEMLIEEGERHLYSTKYKELTGDFYLDL